MSKWTIALAAVLALSMMLVGCGDDTTSVTTEAPPPPLPAADLTATVAGRVVDSSTGAGVSGVSVSAVGTTETTAADGTFTITNIPRTEASSPVILTLTGAPANYPASAAAVVALISDVTPGPVEENVVVAGVEIELHDQAGTITGQILDNTGNPFPGVEITVDAVQIPVVTPGVAEPGPTTGVLPFELTAANSRATTGADGRFTITGVPEDWIYNIIVIPGGGAANAIFTNQFVPSGSFLEFPDTVGAPVDSAVANALGLANALGFVGGFPGPLIIPGPIFPPGTVAAAPVVIVPPINPGDSPDTIPPFVVDNSPLVDGTFIAEADNVAGLTLNFTVSEALGNDPGELAGNNPGASGLRLFFHGRGTNPAALGTPTLIPAEVSLDAAATTVTIAPQVLDAAGAPIALAPGIYQIAGLSALQDVAGNFYNGTTPNLNTRMGFDAANVINIGGNDLNFVILGDTDLPAPPVVASILCVNNSCNSGRTAFTISLAAVPDAVQYFGLFATEDDPIFTSADAAGNPFQSLGPLADPPEQIGFNVSGLSPSGLLGFQFPLITGTETSATPVSNNFFFDGIMYQVGIEAQNADGVRGPQSTVLIGDNTPPSFDTSLAPPARANDINSIPEVLIQVPGGVSAPTNTTSGFTALDDPFTAGMATFIPFEEGTSMQGGTVGFSFFADVVFATNDFGLGMADTFYSAADVTAVLPIASSRVGIRLVEPINTMAMLAAPALSGPGGEDVGTATIAFVNDGDMLNDNDLIGLNFSDVLAPETNSTVDFTGSNISDVVGNALAAGTTLRIANNIPAAVASAVGTAGTDMNDVLTLTFTRPVEFANMSLDAMGDLAVNLGLTDGNIFGGTVALAADGLMLTITTANDNDLAALADDTSLNGAGLNTADALNDIGGGSMLPVNVFAGGTANILVVDEIPPGLLNVTDGDGTQVNSEGVGDVIDGLLEVDDTGGATGETVTLGFEFNQNVLDGTEDGMAGFSPDDVVAAGIDVSVANPAMGTANFFTNDASPSTMVPTATTIFFDVVLNPTGGGPVLEGTRITITGVSDLSGNVATGTTATLCAAGDGVAITSVRVCPP